MLRKVLKCNSLLLLRLSHRKNKKRTNHPKMDRCRAKMKRKRQSRKDKRLTKLNKSMRKSIPNRQSRPKMTLSNNLKESSSNKDQPK